MTGLRGVGRPAAGQVDFAIRDEGAAVDQIDGCRVGGQAGTTDVPATQGPVQESALLALAPLHRLVEGMIGDRAATVTWGQTKTA